MRRLHVLILLASSFDFGFEVRDLRLDGFVLVGHAVSRKWLLLGSCGCVMLV